ncbi:MAG: hypothetical protein ACREJC_12195 [Tepidisphaeraceae bacterium]
MKRAKLLILMAILLTGTARAAVSIVPLSVGPPTNSPQIMRNFGAVIIRLTSTSGNILSVSFSGTNSSGQPLGIFGRLAQRWTSSAGNGVYDTTSPGLLTEANFFPSPSNFDSHFLDTGIAYSITTPLAEGNVFFPDANPIPSDNNQGFGLSGRLASAGGAPEDEGFLTGAFAVPSGTPRTTLDVAYLVLGGSAVVNVRVETVAGPFDVSVFIAQPHIPEPVPTMLAGLFGLIAVSVRPLRRKVFEVRRGSEKRGRETIRRPSAFEGLEARTFLSLAVPSGLIVTMTAGAVANVTWDAVSGATGYRVDWRETPGASWDVLEESIVAPSHSAVDPTEAGEKNSYRVRAFNATDVSDWSAEASPITSVDYVVRVTATWSTSPQGLRLDWEPVQDAPAPPVSGFDVFRKLRSDPEFDDEEPLNSSTLSSGTTHFVDETAELGEAHEYMVRRRRTTPLGPQYEYGYVYAGVEVPLTEDRGTVLLVGTRKGDIRAYDANTGQMLSQHVISDFARASK